MMDSMLSKNGNSPDHSAGFQKGGKGMPGSDPYKWNPSGKEDEDLTWLIK